jgi:hypothetical protein
MTQPPSSSPSTLKMEAIRSSETSVNTTSTRCHIAEDCFLHSHRRENLKSYNLVLIFHDSDYFTGIRTEGQAAILDLNTQNQ